MVNYTGRGLGVKRPGVLSKVQMLNLVWGVGVFSLLPTIPLFCRVFLGREHFGTRSCQSPSRFGIRLHFLHPHFPSPKFMCLNEHEPKCDKLSGPLNRLNAILSLLHPLDRYRTRSPISHPNTGGSPQPPRSKPLGGLNRTIVAL